jgi:hypothetical protein
MQAVAEPNVFKTATASAAGNTALWAPASGKKFRLMRFMIQVPSFKRSKNSRRRAASQRDRGNQLGQSWSKRQATENRGPCELARNRPEQSCVLWLEEIGDAL